MLPKREKTVELAFESPIIVIITGRYLLEILSGKAHKLPAIVPRASLAEYCCNRIDWFKQYL